jgi:uncharacterized protein (DUF1810 family)
MGLCVLVAWFTVGGRVIKCTNRCNCIDGIEKDEMFGAGTVYRRDVQTAVVGRPEQEYLGDVDVNVG